MQAKDIAALVILVLAALVLAWAVWLRYRNRGQ